MGIFLLLAATGAAGSFNAEMDVKTYVDADNANQSFSNSDLLWAASVSGQPSKEVYLSIINLFGSQGIFKPEKISSATLTLDVAQVDKPGKIKAYFLHGATLDTTTWLDKDDYDEEVSSEPADVEDTGSITIDVTPIIQKAVEVCAEGCPYSIVLVAEDDAAVAFDSSSPELEYTTQD
jgi:hypothetical protein